MALSPVIKYLNLALSLMVTNRSKTSSFYSLPDDFRKFEDMKIKDSRIRNFTLEAGSSIIIDRFDDEQNLVLVFGSHPFVIGRLNGISLGSTQEVYSSFFGFWRDRPGSANLQATSVLAIENTLASPDYGSITGSDETDVELIIVEISIES
jgi:hypothetical protein